ncbi:hypothetical protein ABZ614_41750 [Streptomyces sp. NPDC013178]|uniref:hypothetical protein n=1 Tax=Streptomyces sp. NPDC013178 TaxID=3155118 RepID=UPI0033EBB5C1
MASWAFTLPIPAERVEELRELLAEVSEPGRTAGLARRARFAGYHRERMFLQAGEGGAFLIVYLELDEDVDPQEFQRRLMSYQDEWTAWWDPRYTSFFQGRLPVPAELLFAWDDSPRR